MGQLLKWGLLLLAGILVYNYFFGTDVEKERSAKVFGQVGGLVSEIKGVVSAERDQLDAGKYDSAIDKLTGVIGSLKKEARTSGDDSALRRAEELERQKEVLATQVDDVEAQGLSAKGKQSQDKLRQAMQMKKDFDALISRTEKLANDMEATQN